MKLTVALVTLGLTLFLDMSLKFGHCSPSTPMCPWLAGTNACIEPVGACDCDRQCCTNECGYIESVGRLSCMNPDIPIG